MSVFVKNKTYNTMLSFSLDSDNRVYWSVTQYIMNQ